MIWRQSAGIEIYNLAHLILVIFQHNFHINFFSKII